MLPFLVLCVRHSPHARLARWLHGSGPSPFLGLATLVRVCERGTRFTLRADWRAALIVIVCEV